MGIAIGKLKGTFAEASDSAGSQEAREAHPSMIRAYAETRVKMLMTQHWVEIERAWKEAWYSYQKSRGVPRWYINTGSIPNAALKGGLAGLVQSIRVEVALGQPIRVSGKIELDPQSVMRWHNQHITLLSAWEENQIRWRGANPKTFNKVGSFQHMKKSFLSDFLMAGPNTSAGQLPGASWYQAHRGRKQGMYMNVFTNLGNSYRGTAIPTRRAGTAVTGDRLMWYFAFHLGFSEMPHRTAGHAWAVETVLGGLRQQTPMHKIMTVVMQEVRTKFPQFGYESK
jgi:hypothetical protein